MWPTQREEPERSSAQKPSRQMVDSFSTFDLRDELNSLDGEMKNEDSLYEEEDRLSHPVVSRRKPSPRKGIQGPPSKKKTPIRRDQTLPMPPESEDGSNQTFSSRHRRRESQSTVLRRFETEANMKDRRKRAEELRKQKELEKAQEEERRKQAKLEKAKERRKKIAKVDEKSRQKKKKKQHKPTPVSDVHIGDVVLAAKGIAITRWKGQLHFRPNDGIWLGIEFVDGPYGKNDGMVKGTRYFQTKKPNHGSFVKKVNKILTPEALLYKLGNVKSDLNKQLNETRGQLNEVLSKQQEQIELLKQTNNNLTPGVASPGVGSPEVFGSQLSIAKNTLALVTSLSGNLDKYTDNYDDDSEDEYIFTYGENSPSINYRTYSDVIYASSDEEVEKNRTVLKSNRKSLLRVSETEAYSDGSLKKIENDMLEQMKKLEEYQPKKSSKMKRAKTFSNLGLELPEAGASPEQIQHWIISHMSRAPGCPDLENPEILSALGWAMKLFLSVQDDFTY